MMKTTTTAAAFLAALGLASGDSFPYAQPEIRYTPYQSLDLTAQNIVLEKLGYTAQTWNVHRLASIERRGWAGLTSDQLDGAIQLGFTENTWDCFINHYEYYDWATLVDKELVGHFEALGWDENSWAGNGVAPETEGKWWGQLTTAEQEAATQICFFEVSPLRFVHGLVPRHQSDTISLAHQTIQDNWNMKDMNPNPTFFPYPMPEFRYKPWSELDSVAQNTASGLMNYTQDTWNELGLLLAERNTFLNLPGEQREGAAELGFYSHTWDCFMNHYEAYYWCVSLLCLSVSVRCILKSNQNENRSSFHNDLQVAIETLGWTEEMWTSDDSDVGPESESRFWVDLTPEEKAAATRLCYFEETWNRVPVTEWYDYEKQQQTAVTADGPLPKDIDLKIFEESGYAGREPGSVDAGLYTTDNGARSVGLAVTSFGLVLATVLLLA